MKITNKFKFSLLLFRSVLHPKLWGPGPRAVMKPNSEPHTHNAYDPYLRPSDLTHQIWPINGMCRTLYYHEFQTAGNTDNKMKHCISALRCS